MSVGHDWRALIVWHMAMLAPDRIERLVILNIPHFPRSLVDSLTMQMLDCGHWTQQERPADVNRLILDWLSG